MTRTMDGMWKHAVRLSIFVAALAIVPSFAFAKSADHSPSELIGEWHGTSICTDRVAAPACKDETIVYDFTAGNAGLVHWKADKIVNGERQNMGELDVVFNAGEGCWRAEFQSPRVKTVWCLKVSGTALEGTGRQVPGNIVVRKISANKK